MSKPTFSMSYETAREHLQAAHAAGSITTERRDTLFVAIDAEDRRTASEARHRETRPLVVRATVTSPTPRVRMHRLFA